jgi:hypothetical protein
MMVAWMLRSKILTSNTSHQLSQFFSRLIFFSRYIKDFILAARKRVSVLRKRQAANDAEILLDPDEADAKAIAKAQEKVLESVTNENCAFQPDGKARCGLTWCNKLFKGQDFLMKHIRNKHIDLALVRLVRVSEQYMKSRFLAENICTRPVGPIEVEVVGGGLEQKSIKEVYESANARLVDAGPIASVPQMRNDRGGYRGSRGSRGDSFRRDDFRADRRDSHPRDRYDDQDRNDRRSSGDFGRHAPDDRREMEREHRPREDRGDEKRDDRRRESAPASFLEYVPPRAEDNNSRKLQSYADIDSPMVCFDEDPSPVPVSSQSIGSCSLNDLSFEYLVTTLEEYLFAYEFVLNLFHEHP